MTLIELVLATTLATMLMVAVLGVLNSLSRQRNVLFSRREPDTWRRLLADELRRDVLNSRRLAVGPTELRLVGYAGRENSSRRATHRPTEISYQVFSVGEESWLVRRETHLDELSNDNRQAELVCGDVGGIDVVQIESDGTALPLAGSRAGTASGLRRIPSQLTIRLLDASKTTVVFEERIVTH